jgi:hypothetical protein
VSPYLKVFFSISCSRKIFYLNGTWFMREAPVPRGPGRDETPPGTPAGPGDHPGFGSPHWRLVPQSADWPDGGACARDEDPGDPEDYRDPDNAPPSGLDDRELAVLLAQTREVSAAEAGAEAMRAALGQTAVMAAVEAVAAGRRGPGMPGSAEIYPGEHASPAAGFGSGQPLDVAPGCAVLA